MIPTRSGGKARDRARAFLLAGLVVSQFLGFGAPAVANAAVTPELSVGLYHGNGGSSYQGFNGNGSAYPNPQNLTQWGSGDWRLWGDGGGTSPSGTKKSRNGKSLISDLATIPAGSGLSAADGTRPFSFQWTDGANPTSGTDVLAGLKPSAGGEGSGLSLTIPLPRATERLRLWVSAYDGTGHLVVKVPGAPTYTNDDIVGKTNDHGAVVEIDAQGSGDLTVEYTLQCPAKGCTAESHVTMYAAAYTWTGESPSFSVDVTNGQPSEFTVVQGNTTPLVSSVTTSAINPPLDQVTLSHSVTTDGGDTPATGLAVAVSPNTATTFPATSSVTLTPSLNIAAGTYHVTVTGQESGGAVDVNTANFKVTVLPRTQVPFLYRAFPNEGGGASVEGVMHGDAGQTYRVALSSATSSYSPASSSTTARRSS